MEPKPVTSWKKKLHSIVYESNTTAGKLFDIALLVFILSSIVIVMLDSMSSFHDQYGALFIKLEWIFTIIFTIEYILRLLAIDRPWLYVFSFFGIIDVLAILPAYLSIFDIGAHSLLVFRALRLLRIFRIFKLAHFLSEAEFLKKSLMVSLKKISIFLLVVFTIVIILGSVMYMIENGENGFNSIPDSIYWAIVTITTVGYGDISPQTPLGKLVASIIMFIGYGIIAVPTGIITSDMARQGSNSKRQREIGHETCPGCGREDHDANALYCKICGTSLY